MEPGKRAAEARAKMNRQRTELVELSPGHAKMLGVPQLELHAPTMAVSNAAFRAEGWDTLAIALSAMVWMPAEGEQPAEPLWPNPSDVGAVDAGNAPAVNWLYEKALAFIVAGRGAAPKG